jgi:hypothetical protein
MKMKDRQIRNQLAIEKEFWHELGSLMRARILLIERHGNRGLGFLEQRMADKIVAMYDWFHITGDASASDMGLELNLASVCECAKIEKTITAYEPIVSQ